ncbi:hypothetical protein IE982_06545 [Enterobacter hormaechei]|nr:hypothetical protein [Enterobacter hormaechei]
MQQRTTLCTLPCKGNTSSRQTAAICWTALISLPRWIASPAPEKTNGQLKAEKQTLAERNAALTTQAGADGAEHLKLLAGYEGDLKAARDESAALRGLAMSKQLEEALAHFPERLHSLIKPQIAGMLDLVKAEDGSYAVQMKTGTDGAGVAFDGKEFGLHRRMMQRWAA